MPLSLKLLGHLKGDKASKAESSEKKWAFWLDCKDFLL